MAPADVTLTSEQIVLATTFDKTTEPAPTAFKVIFWFAPALMLYVTIALGVPVKEIVAFEPWQMAVFPEIVAVGLEFTVITAVLLRVVLQVFKVTSTKL